MRKTYQVLANAIAVLVVVQAGAIAWAFFGLTNEIDQNGLVINKACLESEAGCGGGFTAEWGFAIHMFFNGTVLMPLVALVLLVVSFFAKVRGGVALALTIVALLVLQIVLLPMLSREVDATFGALHGINALVLMGVAAMAGRRAATPKQSATTAPPETATV
ncbi:hypothetical protein [Nocardioides sp. GXQ0305]|uniref:hypothetical protein n=1 Tax=Nocardioides sp. GXQ0305 TaxID=3423912 RepID=UPI003D7D6F65